MRLYEATAYVIFDDEFGIKGAKFIVHPEHIFAETESDAEKMFILHWANTIEEYRIEEVTILVRPFA